MYLRLLLSSPNASIGSCELRTALFNYGLITSLQVVLNREAAWTLTFGSGTYRFDASYNYPQLEKLEPSEVLTEAASDLITQNPDQTTSLSFLSYTDKLLAGTWRFLTYFGRDSMISMLLMQPILSESAIEAVIGAVLERVNRTDGMCISLSGAYGFITNNIRDGMP